MNSEPLGIGTTRVLDAEQELNASTNWKSKFGHFIYFNLVSLFIVQSLLVCNEVIL